jgi:5-oxoprolinase (ATP-hydrolysing) subunit A
MLICDLNCDMGEGIGNEEMLMPFISSANIACGYHAGDVDTMKKTIALCRKFGVAIGAHPSYPDRENFGRTDLAGKTVSVTEVEDIVSEQVLLLQELCNAEGAKLHHVKPHGALYNRAAWDEEVADFICRGIKKVNTGLLVYGLSGSRFCSITAANGLRFVHEVFADRSYQDDGSLTPRNAPHALIEDEQQCINQVLEMVHNHRVKTINGNFIAVDAGTICVHGDGRHAVVFAKRLHETLTKSTISGLND